MGKRELTTEFKVETFRVQSPGDVSAWLNKQAIEGWEPYLMQASFFAGATLPESFTYTFRRRKAEHL